MQLTPTNIALAKPKQILRDATVPGLELRVGVRKRVYYLYYRTKTGVERRPKIGDYAIMSLGQARALAKSMLVQVAMGEDPSYAVKQQRLAPTVNELIDVFLDVHLAKRKATTKTNYAYHLNRHLRPAFGKRKVTQVTHTEIEDLHAWIGRRAPVEANRFVSVASKLFTFAEQRGLRPTGSNPCRNVERFPEQARRRYMTQEESRAVAMALSALRATHLRSVDFILLLILTGARKGEIAQARWEHVKGDRIELPGELCKSGQPRTIFLSPPARALLAVQPRGRGTLFGIKSPRDCWDRVRELTGITDLRIHDLRHTYASVLLDQGYGLEQIGQLLGHKNAQTTKRYAHLVKDTAVEATEKAGVQLTQWLGG